MNNKTWYLQVRARKQGSLGLFAPIGITVEASTRTDADKAAIAEFNASGFECEYIISAKELGNE